MSSCKPPKMPLTLFDQHVVCLLELKAIYQPWLSVWLLPKPVTKGKRRESVLLTHGAAHLQKRIPISVNSFVLSRQNISV